VGDPFQWVNVTGNSWRTNGDIDPHWDSILFEADHANVADDGTPLWTVTGPNSGWGDADMLEVGVCVNCDGSPGSTPQRLTLSEGRAHMSLWALLKSPLLAGLDPTRGTPDDIATLTNAAVLAISQDKAGVQGRQLAPRPLAALPSDGDAAVLRPCHVNSTEPLAAQAWRWGWPAAGNLGLSSSGIGSSATGPLCLTVGNLTDKDSHRPMMLVRACAHFGAVGINQSFVYNQTTRTLVPQSRDGAGRRLVDPHLGRGAAPIRKLLIVV